MARPQGESTSYPRLDHKGREHELRIQDTKQNHNTTQIQDNAAQYNALQNKRRQGRNPRKHAWGQVPLLGAPVPLVPGKPRMSMRSGLDTTQTRLGTGAASHLSPLSLEGRAWGPSTGRAQMGAKETNERTTDSGFGRPSTGPGSTTWGYHRLEEIYSTHEYIGLETTDYGFRIRLTTHRP